MSNMNMNITAVNTVTTASSTLYARLATLATSPLSASPDTSPFTYSHKEVQQLLEDARLDGWDEGYEEGCNT